MNEKSFETFKSIKDGRLARSFYDAAIALVRDKNIDDIKINDITDSTFVSRQTFYNYFNNKNAFLDYVFFRGIENKIYGSSPKEVITNIIPSEIECNLDFYSKIAQTKGDDSFESFFTELISDYYHFLVSRQWTNLEINRNITTALEIYVSITVKYFMQWLLDKNYQESYTAKEIGLVIYKDIPSSLFPAFESATDSIVNKTKDSSVINLGIGLWVGQEFVAGIIDGFHAKHPDLMINVVKSGHYHSIKSYDVGLEISSYEFSDNHYNHYALCNHGIVMLVSRQNPLSKYDHAKITDFKDQRVVLPGYRELKMIQRGHRDYTTSEYDFSKNFIVNELFGIPDYVILKNNMGVILKSTLDGVSDNDFYKVVKIDDFKQDKPLEIPIELYVQKEYELSPNERELMQFILSYSKTVQNLRCTESFVSQMKNLF